MTAYADDPAAAWHQRGYTYRQQEAWLVGPDSLTDKQGAFLERQLGDATTILEVGCGYGRLLERLASRRPWCWLIGLDFSATQLTQARAYLEHHLPAVCLVAADARAIPVADQAVDVAYTQGCLMHIPPAHVEDVREELRRVARTVLHIEETVSSGARCLCPRQCHLLRTRTVATDGDRRHVSVARAWATRDALSSASSATQPHRTRSGGGGAIADAIMMPGAAGPWKRPTQRVRLGANFS